MAQADKNIKMWKLLDSIEDIPTLPAVALQVLEMSNDSSAEIGDMANLMLADQVLAAKTLKLVNSTSTGLRRRIESLREAIVFMGLKGIKNLVLTSSLMDMFSPRSRVFDPLTFWEHSFGCALFSALISRQIGYEDPEQAYMAGLLHDIGEVVLCQFLRSEFETAMIFANETATEMHIAEQKTIGFCHTDIGPWLISKWQFPEEIAEVTACHHDVEHAEINPSLVAIAHLADLFCQLRGLGHDYYERIQVTIEDTYAWFVLSKYYEKMRDMDIERLTFELDGKVKDIKATVGYVFQTGRENENMDRDAQSWNQLKVENQ